jgi:methionyl-tRNA formyltransferase
MKTFVIGSKELSCIVLDTLIAQGHEVLGVYSRDHEPGMQVWHKLGHRSLEATAARHKIPVYKDQKVNSPASIERLRAMDLDVIFSCFWSELFKEPLLSLPHLGVFNFHTALLPSNRGSRPIPWTIIKGESHAGLTLHRMQTGVDDGPLLAQTIVEIDACDTAETVYNRLSKAAKKMFEKVLPHFEVKARSLTTQDVSRASFQLRGEPYGGALNHFWQKDQIDRFKRAFTFPPFRAWRRSAQEIHDPGLRILFQSRENQNAKLLAYSSIQLHRTQLSGGNATDRSQLRQLLQDNRKSICISETHLDLEHYLPVLEALQRNAYYTAMTERYPAELFDRFELSQPRFLTNGVLQIPSVELNDVPACIALIQAADAHCQVMNIPLYVTILSNDQIIEEACRALTQQNLTSSWRLVSALDVYNEYDTTYEEIST